MSVCVYWRHSSTPLPSSPCPQHVTLSLTFQLHDHDDHDDDDGDGDDDDDDENDGGDDRRRFYSFAHYCLLLCSFFLLHPSNRVLCVYVS